MSFYSSALFRYGLTSLLVLAVPLLAVLAFWWYCVRLPDRTSSRTLHRSTAVSLQSTTIPIAEQDDGVAAEPIAPIQEQAENFLREIIHHLAIDIGERHLSKYSKLMKAADYIEARFQEFGYEVRREKFQVNNLDCFNLIVEKTGTTLPDEILLVGAHYDTAYQTPGANDNGSGVAALLYIAQQLKDVELDRSIRLVAFTNEEPPYFQRENQMGSWVHAKKSRQKSENLVGVISLETMGYFSDQPKSQQYPPLLSPFYPDTGNFIGFVSDLRSRDFLQASIEAFMRHSDVPVERASLPASVQGVGWSDHWSFWQEGYVGIMVTDTAPFRYPHYHQPTDTPDQIDYQRYTSVVLGMTGAITELANQSSQFN